MKSSYNFYKLFGYDIMLDSQCFPKLIEINSRPAALDDKLDSFVNRWRHLINISFTDSTLSDKHEGFIEELSTCFYLDTTLLKFLKVYIWNINIQYENDWNTLQKLPKPVFVFRH